VDRRRPPLAAEDRPCPAAADRPLPCLTPDECATHPRIRMRFCSRAKRWLLWTQHGHLVQCARRPWQHSSSGSSLSASGSSSDQSEERRGLFNELWDCALKSNTTSLTNISYARICRHMPPCRHTAYMPTYAAYFTRGVLQLDDHGPVRLAVYC